MIIVGKNTNNKPFYGMAEFLCDYTTDVANLPTNRAAGSIARVIEDGSIYILNSEKQWILQPKISGGGDTPTDTIIYDGGTIT